MLSFGERHQWISNLLSERPDNEFSVLFLAGYPSNLISGVSLVRPREITCTYILLLVVRRSNCEGPVGYDAKIATIRATCYFPAK